MKFKYIYWTNLDVELFSSMLSNRTNSHKYFFFDALMHFIIKEKKIISFSDIANEMIASAWYPVTEHYIHLGRYSGGMPKDTIERAVNYIRAISSIAPNARPEKIIGAIAELEKTGNKGIRSVKEQILDYAPSRLLSPFLKNSATEEDFAREQVICERIQERNEISPIPYTILWSEDKLSRRIKISEEWYPFLRDNAVEISGWINNEKLAYLQGRNPNVPGLIFKLTPGQGDRNLTKVRRLWECILNVKPIKNIYTNESIEIDNFVVDHFIPWSYVACNELWNLCPISPETNMSKSNKLAPEEYIKQFISVQYEMYGLIFEEVKKHIACPEYSSSILQAYDDCLDDHLYAPWANKELFVLDNDDFCKILYEHIISLYDSALSQGYQIWKVESIN